MKGKVIILCTLLTVHPALAETYRAGTPCDARAKHEPAPDVAYQPGTDAEGWYVPPADLEAAPNPFDEAVRGGVWLQPAVPLSDYMPEGRRADQMRETEIPLGIMGVTPDGNAILNGIPLESGNAGAGLPCTEIEVRD